MIQAWSEFVRRPEVRSRAVFPRRLRYGPGRAACPGRRPLDKYAPPSWEACGTSGMKVLVFNGGLNLSELDGWWAEAYARK
jgi:starch phosphorylase